ncbi:hypothetical protein [Citricoccus sp. NR2]|uniref:hypothetical protein n=1 Tax=Citricoccus sp. NR2 TaxID=3004095 RepID=UPI0022DE24CD|nr:hypothetical protein [Citricoccus sp. NR2]WBL18711.1 hypothetical protein O1A05_13285 [Citricoccus sp. NR2]
MRAKIGTILLSMLLLLFAVLALWSAIGFIRSGSVIAAVIGVSVIIIVGISIWLITREILFGLRSERMAQVLESEGGLPEDTLPRSPGGRIDRAEADRQFELYRAEAEAAPEDWRSWFRLSLAYDASGDRRRARSAMREAIRRFLAAS